MWAHTSEIPKYCEFTVTKYKILWVYCESIVKTKKAHVCNSKKNNVCKSKNHKHCKIARLCQNIIHKFGTGQMRNAKRPKICCRPSGSSQQQRPKLVGEYTTTTQFTYNIRTQLNAYNACICAGNDALMYMCCRYHCLDHILCMCVPWNAYGSWYDPTDKCKHITIKSSRTIC